MSVEVISTEYFIIVWFVTILYLKINNINLQYFVKKIPNKQKKSKEKGNKPTKNLKNPP